MKRLIAVMVFALLCVGCGPEGELKNKLAELKKTVVTKDTTIPQAFDALKEANDFLGEVKNTEKEEEEKYPELEKDARDFRNQRIKELESVGGGAVKSVVATIWNQVNSGQPIDINWGEVSSKVDFKKYAKSILGIDDPRFQKFAGPEREPTDPKGAEGWP